MILILATQNLTSPGSEFDPLDEFSRGDELSIQFRPRMSDSLVVLLTIAAGLGGDIINAFQRKVDIDHGVLSVARERR